MVSLLDQTISIRAAFNHEVHIWQKTDAPREENSIGIIIDGKAYPLDMSSADMVHMFDKFLEAAMEVAEENEW